MMGTRGPATKPTALKLLRGNPGKRALPKNEPKPKLAVPVRPTWMAKRGWMFWDLLLEQLVPMRVMTEADVVALAMLADALGEWNAAAHNKGSERIVGADAMRRATALLGRFGLTPSDRTRLTTEELPPSDPFEEFRDANRRTS